MAPDAWNNSQFGVLEMLDLDLAIFRSLIKVISAEYTGKPIGTTYGKYWSVLPGMTNILHLIAAKALV